MGYSTRSKKKGGKGWIIFIIILICWGLLFFPSSYNAKLTYNNKVIDIEKGDGLAKFYNDFWGVQKIMIKLWLKNNPEKVPLL